MKRVICLFVAVCLLTIVIGGAEARNNPLKKGRLVSLSDGPRGVESAVAVNDSFFNDLHIGALWFPAVSNKGYVGYWDLSAYYPGGGDQSNVWQAGMWGGGYVEGRANAWRYLGSDGSDSDPAQYDTLDEQAVVERKPTSATPTPTDA